MNNQTTAVLGINTSCPTRATRLSRPDAAAKAGRAGCEGAPCWDCGDTIRRMRIDREGILDMLVKGRGSGL